MAQDRKPYIPPDLRPKAPKPEAKPSSGYLKPALATGLRVAGPAIGAIGGGILGSAVPVVGTGAGAVGGGAFGGAAGEYLAQLLEGRGRDKKLADLITGEEPEPINLKRVGVSAALGAVPGSWMVRSGNPLVSAAIGSGLGYAGTAGYKAAEGASAREALDPTQWSGTELLTGPVVGGAVGGAFGKLTKKVPSTAAKAPKFEIETTAQTGPGTMTATGGKITPETRTKGATLKGAKLAEQKPVAPIPATAVKPTTPAPKPPTPPAAAKVPYGRPAPPLSKGALAVEQGKVARDTKNLKAVEAWKARNDALKAKQAAEAEKLAENEAKLAAIEAAKEGRKETEPSISEGVTAKTPEGGRASMTTRFVKPTPPKGTGATGVPLSDADTAALGLPKTEPTVAAPTEVVEHPRAIRQAQLAEELPPVTPDSIARAKEAAAVEAAQHEATQAAFRKAEVAKQVSEKATKARSGLRIAGKAKPGAIPEGLRAELKNRGYSDKTLDKLTPEQAADELAQELVVDAEINTGLPTPVAGKAKPVPVENDIAYKGYFVGKNPAGETVISRGGKEVGRAKNNADAKLIIDSQLPLQSPQADPLKLGALPKPAPVDPSNARDLEFYGKSVVERAKQIQIETGTPTKMGVGWSVALRRAAKEAKAAKTTPEAPKVLEGGAIPVRGEPKPAFTKNEAYSPEANARLDDIGAKYRAATDPVEKRGLGAQMSEIKRAEKARIAAEKPVPPKADIVPGPAELTSDDLTKMTPDEQSKALAELVKRLKGEKGEIDPALLMKLTSTGVGAAAGAVTTPEDRLKGTLLGGLAGFGAGTAAGKLASRGGMTGSGRTVRELAQPVTGRAANYIRGGLLSDPRGMFINSVLGPGGSNFWGGVEELVKGTLTGDSVRAETGRKAIASAANIPGWLKTFSTKFDDALNKLHDVEGRAGEIERIGERTKWDKVVEFPATLMLTGDLTSAEKLTQSGIPEPLMRVFTNTAEPQRWLWKKIADFPRGEYSAMVRILAPFVRTAANIMESGTQRTPILGDIINIMGNPRLKIPVGEQIIQEGIGVVVFGLGYAAGLATDPDTNRVLKVRNAVSNLGGHYSLLSGAGFAAGQAVRAGRNPYTSVVTEFEQGMPLPSTDPVRNIATAGYKAATGEFDTPMELIPRMAIPKLFLLMEETGIGLPGFGSVPETKPSSSGQYIPPDLR